MAPRIYFPSNFFKAFPVRRAIQAYGVQFKPFVIDLFFFCWEMSRPADFEEIKILGTENGLNLQDSDLDFLSKIKAVDTFKNGLGFEIAIIDRKNYEHQKESSYLSRRHSKNTPKSSMKSKAPEGGLKGGCHPPYDNEYDNDYDLDNDLNLKKELSPEQTSTTTPDEAERAFEEALATVQTPAQESTKTSKSSPTRLSGAAKMERKQAAIQRLIDQTSKPLWFTGSESIIELRRFLEICQAKKKIPKFAATVAGWLAQYESLDHFLMAVQLSIKNEWCTLLRYSDVVRYSGGDKKADRSEEIKKSFWNLRDQLAGDEVYEKN